MKPSNIIPTKPSQINGDKSSIHSSLSNIPMNGIKKTNQVESNTLQIRPPRDIQQKKSFKFYFIEYRKLNVHLCTF